MIDLADMVWNGEARLCLDKVLECMDDPEADADNAVLSKEQED